MAMGKRQAVTSPIGPGTGPGNDSDVEFTESVLNMIQLCDSFFPSGSFTLSHGLESWIQQRDDDPELSELTEWILSFMNHAIVPNQGVVLLNTHRLSHEGESGNVRSLDSFYRATITSAERRSTSVKEGASVRELIRRSFDPDRYEPSSTVRECWNELCDSWSRSEGTFAVTLGLVGALLGLSDEEVCSVYFYSVSRTIAAAAMRIGVLNHFEAQEILRQTNERIPQWYEQINGKHWSEATNKNFRYRRLAVEHEDADLRLFST